jgi:hypothetical protein
MPRLIEAPAIVTAAGTPPKRIAEYVGRLRSANSEVSIAVMESPAGWSEPGQRPEFDEYTVVLHGVLEIEHESGRLRVPAGQAAIAVAGEWVRYSTPQAARYVSVCLPAFSPDMVHRDK